MEKEYKNILPELIEYIGTARYDEGGTIIWAAKGEELQHLADVRGWGHLQNKFPTEQDAMFFQDAVGEFIADAINEKIEKCKQIETYMDNCKKFGEIKMVGTPLDKFPEPETKYTVQNIPPIELKNLKNPE